DHGNATCRLSVSCPRRHECVSRGTALARVLSRGVWPIGLAWLCLSGRRIRYVARCAVIGRSKSGSWRYSVFCGCVVCGRLALGLDSAAHWFGESNERRTHVVRLLRIGWANLLHVGAVGQAFVTHGGRCDDEPLRLKGGQ